MPIPAVVASLPAETRAALTTIVKPKFDAYFAFTAGGQARSVPVQGQPWFVYPEHTMIPDLAILWALYSDVYQSIGGPKQMAQLVAADPQLTLDVRRILEGHSSSELDGSFWHYPKGRIPLSDAMGVELEKVLQTLRNSYAHSHWHFANLSAIDYWAALGWDTTNAPKDFDLPSRGPKNYMMYIADATPPWKGADFWSMNDLRIIVTPSTILRYHLHLFLNHLLNGQRTDVFGNSP